MGNPLFFLKYCVERVSRTSLTTILWKSCSQGWELSCGEGSPISRTLKKLQFYLDSANKMVHAERLPSFWENGIWHVSGRGCLGGESPVKTLGTEFLRSIPVDVSHVWSQLTDPLGEEPWKLAPSHHEPLPFALSSISVHCGKLSP